MFHSFKITVGCPRRSRYH